MGKLPGPRALWCPHPVQVSMQSRESTVQPTEGKKKTHTKTYRTAATVTMEQLLWLLVIGNAQLCDVMQFPLGWANSQP